MSDKEFFRGSKNPIGLFQSLHFDSQFYQAHPDFFHPCGIWVFTGPQGSGKTLSAVKCVKALKKNYPAAVVCSNLFIDLPDVIPFTDYEQIKTLSNGEKGIIFLIDEIHVLWNSLESKNIPISEMAVFSQMRKDRRVIIGTSQVYGRIAKPIREQLRYAIVCKSYLKYLQVNQVLDPNGEGCRGEDDGELDAERIYLSWFFHRPSDYVAYNTYTKINRLERKKVVK